jgi:surface antigen
MRRRVFRRRAIRIGLLASNIVVLLVIVAVVVQNPHTDGLATPVASSVTEQNEAANAVNPLDQLSSADIALTVARMNNLPEATAINNQAQSQAAELASSISSDSVLSKPQVVTTALKSRADIKTYIVQDGDSVSSLAAKFGVTSDSIRWSNGLTGEALTPGNSLAIPPVNGIVYIVKDGDTADSLATKYKASKDQILAYNDAEIGGLRVGERIIIPNATQATVTTASAVAAVAATSFAWGGGQAVYGYNGYDYGYCTWYAANKVPVPSNWGNANTWDNLARLSGWQVSSVPVAGAVAQTDAGYFGHVAVVEAVSDDGTMIKYSDMNGLAGFGRVGYSDWTSASKFQHYIYR